MHIALTQPLCYNVAHDIRMPLLPSRNQSALCAFGKFLWVRAYKVFDLRPGISLHADGDENGRQASMGTLQVRSLLRPPHAGLNCLIAWGGSIRYYLYYRLLDHMILAACASRHQRANRPFTTVPRGLSPTVYHSGRMEMRRDCASETISTVWMPSDHLPTQGDPSSVSWQLMSNALQKRCPTVSNIFDTAS